MKELRKVVVPIGPGIAYVELTKSQWACINSEDADVMGKCNWFALWNPYTKSFYAQRWGLKVAGKRKAIMMHGEILGGKSDKPSDHRSGHTLDNRSQNLRRATYSENAKNRRHRSDNASGCVGVSYHEISNRWRVQLSVEGKRVTLGRFVEKEHAIRICLAAREEHYGEFRRVA